MVHHSSVSIRIPFRACHRVDGWVSFSELLIPCVRGVLSIHIFNRFPEIQCWWVMDWEMQVTLGEPLVDISANLCLRLFSDLFSPVLGGGPLLVISHLTKLQCILWTSAVQ